MRALSVITLLAAFILPTGAFAEVQTITATHTYILSDNDSRNDARQLCFLQAKQKVLEQAENFIQSHSVVNNFELTKDQIAAYSAAVLSVEVVKEDVGLSNGQNTLTLTVKADVDVDQVNTLLAAIVVDKNLADRIAYQQQQIRELEGQVQALNSRLNIATSGAASELRKERKVVFENIAALDRIQLVATQRIAREKETIQQKTEKILKYVLRDMTPQEVLSLVGEPVKKWLFSSGGFGLNWYYGELWICFDEPLGLEDWRVEGIGRAGPFPNPLRVCSNNLLSQ
ncbi:MAG TPA: hypothetical protein VK901_22655 [Nitrospiraceae bacterium]|nr:hypothetical protein [Nitrospiraceae bacterium]